MSRTSVDHALKQVVAALKEQQKRTVVAQKCSGLLERIVAFRSANPRYMPPM